MGSGVADLRNDGDNGGEALFWGAGGCAEAQVCLCGGLRGVRRQCRGWGFARGRCVAVGLGWVGLGWVGERAGWVAWGGFGGGRGPGRGWGSPSWVQA